MGDIKKYGRSEGIFGVEGKLNVGGAAEDSGLFEQWGRIRYLEDRGKE